MADEWRERNAELREKVDLTELLDEQKEIE